MFPDYVAMELNRTNKQRTSYGAKDCHRKFVLVKILVGNDFQKKMFQFGTKVLEKWTGVQNFVLDEVLCFV